MENEFSRIDLTCTAESMVPLGPGYDDIANQVCTLPGSSPGTSVIAGSDYMRSGFSYNLGDLWRNFGIIFLIVAVFLFANAALGEYIIFGNETNAGTVYVKPNKDRIRLNKALVERRHKNRYSKDAQGPKFHITSKAILTWECLNYVVPTPAGKLRLLNNIYGYVKPGELTALMGASGSGKTTLLDVLAARKTIGVITGDILVDGIKPGIAFQRSISYAEQIDVHEPTQTVREALRFSADLRQPVDVPQSEKYAYVEEILSLLEMDDLADAVIGEPEAGLSVEQRKRVTIGVELAAKPELLFLDEPVSILLNRWKS
jgi:ATP-binding cassette, subfamily G (WHITE), member 2, SNQ2